MTGWLMHCFKMGYCDQSYNYCSNIQSGTHTTENSLIKECSMGDCGGYHI